MPTFHALCLTFKTARVVATPHLYRRVDIHLKHDCSENERLLKLSGLPRQLFCHVNEIHILDHRETTDPMDSDGSTNRMLDDHASHHHEVIESILRKMARLQTFRYAPSLASSPLSSSTVLRTQLMLLHSCHTSYCKLRPTLI